MILTLQTSNCLKATARNYLSHKLNSFQCYRVDPRFPLPKVAIYIRLSSPVAIPPRTQAVAGESESKESGNRPTSAGAFESDRVAAAVLHDLLTRLLTDALGEEAYMAAMAELELSVCNSDSAISLTVQVLQQLCVGESVAVYIYIYIYIFYFFIWLVCLVGSVGFWGQGVSARQNCAQTIVRPP